MKVQAKIPLMFNCRPKRTHGEKAAFVSEVNTYEIPEVSSSETEIEFETERAFLTHLTSFREGKACHTVLSFDGSLYRPIHDDFNARAAKVLFDAAFPGFYGNSDQPFKASISPRDRVTNPESETWLSPLMRPVYEQLLWRFKCESVDKKRMDSIWPPLDYVARHKVPKVRVLSNEIGQRNNIQLDAIWDDLLEFDEDGLVHSRSASHHHMQRYIFVDGHLHQRCGPPVYVVGLKYGYVSVALTHAPEWHDTDLSTQYFGLANKESAFAYADALTENFLRNSRHLNSKKPKDYTISFSSSDHPAFEFHHAEDQLFRIACGVAVENRRIVCLNSERVRRLGDQKLAAVSRAFEEVRKTDFVFETFGDPVDDMEANIDTWITLGRRQSTYSFGEGFTSEMLFTQAGALEADRPISLIPTSQKPSP